MTLSHGKHEADSANSGDRFKKIRILLRSGNFSNFRYDRKVGIIHTPHHHFYRVINRNYVKGRKKLLLGSSAMVLGSFRTKSKTTSLNY